MQYNIKLVSQWAHDRGLTDQTNDALRSQFIKGVEEGGEIFEAILKRDKDLLVDAIGDELVVLTIMCINAGLEPEKYIRRISTKDIHQYRNFESGVISSLNTNNALQYGVFQGELARALCKNEPIKPVLHRMVTALNYMCSLCCIDIGECYRTAYNEIKNRTGRKVDGVFVKDE